jgi:hypothetical protein
MHLETDPIRVVAFGGSAHILKERAYCKDENKIERGRRAWE